MQMRSFQEMEPGERTCSLILGLIIQVQTTIIKVQIKHPLLIVFFKKKDLYFIFKDIYTNSTNKKFRLNVVQSSALVTQIWKVKRESFDRFNRRQTLSNKY